MLIHVLQYELENFKELQRVVKWVMWMVKIRGEATQKLDTNILPSFLDFFCGQFSNQSGNLDVNQQLQMALEERASLETQIAQVRCCIKYIDDPIPDFCKETCMAEERSPSFVLFFSSFILYAVSHLIYSADTIFFVFCFAQLSESLHQLQTERDQYVEKLKEEGSIWQQRVQQLAEQVTSRAASQLLLVNTGVSAPCVLF